MGESLKSLSEEITSFTQMSNQSYPYVIMPTFEANAHHAMSQSGMRAISIIPIVKKEDRAAYEAYAVKNQGWVADARQLVLDGQDESVAAAYKEGSITPFIYQDGDHGQHELPQSMLK